MPELPEVETTRRGIQPHIQNQAISKVVVRESRLRWPVPDDLSRRLGGLVIEAVNRRGKYILLDCHNPANRTAADSGSGTLILHLGMSGNLRVVSPELELRKHDHVDIELENRLCLRFHDPRRFGAILWTNAPADEHKLLSELGPEPLGAAFNADYLFALSRQRKVNVKSFIMNSHVVVGVGNIYANEALFRSGIDPRRSAGRISKKRYQRLVEDIKEVLDEAITQGGTTLRDFTSSDGKPGYFSQSLAVYGRGGQACVNCGHPLEEIRIGQRASVYCKSCQR